MQKLLVLAVGVSALIASVAWALTPAELAGSWNVTLTANFSTCDSVKEGEVQAMQWVVNAKPEGKLTIKTIGHENSSAEYIGTFRDKSLRAQTKPEVHAKGHQATIEVTVADGKMTGRRVVANNGPPSPCAIIYDVSAKKL